MEITRERIEELINERNSLVDRHNEATNMIKNIEVRITKIDGILEEYQIQAKRQNESHNQDSVEENEG